ncbi:MAG: hypothetical protein JW837_02690 [Sedimentisphaerales bacterium]|nr:hypothetical protein [Sedimentisphaerales bacterium]
MKKGQAVLAGAAALAMGVTAGVIIYMAFVFPKTLAVWEQEARELSGFQMMAANVSTFCTQYGLIILPVILFGFLVSSLWMILTIKKETTIINKT